MSRVTRIEYESEGIRCQGAVLGVRFQLFRSSAASGRGTGSLPGSILKLIVAAVLLENALDCRLTL